MRLTNCTFVLLCSTLIGTWGLVRPSELSAAEDRFAAYYQPADDESESDKTPSDEPPLPEETTDELASDENPAEEVPDEDRAPDELPSDGERPERLPGAEMPGEPAPPTPVTEGDSPVESVPLRRETTPLPESTTTPDYGTVVPGQHNGTPSTSAAPKGWGYNGGCCANVWDGYCEELRGCQRCCRGRGRLWCRIMCRKSKRSCGRTTSCRHHGGSGCCQHGGTSCCRASTKVRGDDGVVPPVPPEPVPYASAANLNRNRSAVVLQHWDMPRITSKGGKSRQ